MLARAVLLIPTLAAIALCAFVFDASRASEAAAARTQAALELPNERAVLLAEAHEELKHAWSHPIAWRPQAAEAAAHIALLSDNRADAIALTSANLARAPLQPLAWIRLAALGDDEHGAPACDARTCLANSWTAAPMLAPDAACVRLQLGVAHGMLARDDDPRFAAYAAASRSINERRACYAGLPPARAFQQILRSR